MEEEKKICSGQPCLAIIIPVKAGIFLFLVFSPPLDIFFPLLLMIIMMLAGEHTGLCSNINKWRPRCYRYPDATFSLHSPVIVLAITHRFISDSFFLFFNELFTFRAKKKWGSNYPSWVSGLLIFFSCC